MSVHESIEFFPLFDPEPGEAAGLSVAIGSGIAAVGAPEALGGSGAVVLYSYSAEKNGWGYVGVLAGSKIAGTEQVRALGCSCVAFGDTVIVGAQGDGATPGRVFVLAPAYGAWSYTAIPVIAELTRKDPAKGDLFGASVAHCSDGTVDYVAVGAPGANPPSGVAGKGQVFIFRGLEASHAPWSTSPIANPNPAGKETDLFGATVAINASVDEANQCDGTLTLAVGAPGANEGCGAVYVGRTSEPGTWTSTFTFAEPLVAVFPTADDDFRTSGYGTSVALTGGTTLAVGSPEDPNFDAMIEGTGAVWIYNCVDGVFVAQESGGILYGAAEGSRFGASLAFPETVPADVGGEKPSATQGSYLVVGAPGQVEDAAEPASAYRYVNELVDGRPAGLTFTEDARFVASNGKPGNKFASAVAISTYALGTWCLVGAPLVPNTEQEGGGYLYADGDPKPTWMPTPELLTAPPLRWGGLPPDWWKKFTPEIPTYLS